MPWSNDSTRVTVSRCQPVANQPHAYRHRLGARRRSTPTLRGPSERSLAEHGLTSELLKTSWRLSLVLTAPTSENWNAVSASHRCRSCFGLPGRWAYRAWNW
jgi:hypothetical protein